MTSIPSPPSSLPPCQVISDEPVLEAIVSPLASGSESAINPWSEVLQVFLSTFFTVFLAELGDKTQVTTLLIAAESHAPWIVFTAAACALVLTSLLGVLLGQWLSHRIAPKALQKAAGICLLLISLGLLWDVLGCSGEFLSWLQMIDQQ